MTGVQTCALPISCGSFANSIRGFMEGAYFPPRMSPSGLREYAVARFDRSVMARNYLEQYKAVIEGASW